MATSSTSKPMKAALYARVSTLDKGQDPETQLLPLRRLAEVRGWQVTEFVDQGISGSKSSRPALDKLMAEARRGKVDVVVVARFDRFARSTTHLAHRDFKLSTLVPKDYHRQSSATLPFCTP